MTAKEYLEKIHLLDEYISQKKWELEDIERKRTLVSAIDYSKERLSGSKSGDAPFVKASDKLVDLSHEISREIENFSAERHRIINLIQGLKDYKLSRVLHEHYVKYKDFSAIAKEMNYAYQYILELHTEALKNFESSYKILLNF